MGENVENCPQVSPVQIYVDGTDIKGYNLQWYRSQLAVVTQEPSLFNGTIGENILYGNPEASTEELQDAMVRSGVQSFVSELPDVKLLTTYH